MASEPTPAPCRDCLNPLRDATLIATPDGRRVWVCDVCGYTEFRPPASPVPSVEATPERFTQRTDPQGVRLVRTGMPERVVLADIAAAIRDHDLTLAELRAILDDSPPPATPNDGILTREEIAYFHSYMRSFNESPCVENVRSLIASHERLRSALLDAAASTREQAARACENRAKTLPPAEANEAHKCAMAIRSHGAPSPLSVRSALLRSEAEPRRCEWCEAGNKPTAYRMHVIEVPCSPQSAARSSSSETDPNG